MYAILTKNHYKSGFFKSAMLSRFVNIKSIKNITMKTIIFLLLTSMFTLPVIVRSNEQVKAQACGGGCDYFNVTVKRTKSCASESDMTFIVTNNFGRAADIKVFVEKTGGMWKSLGYKNYFSPGQTTSDFWSCGNTGRYILYYKEAGSNATFPSESEIQRLYGQ